MTIRAWKIALVLVAATLDVRTAQCQDSPPQAPMELVRRLADAWNRSDFQGLMDLLPSEPARSGGFSKEEDADLIRQIMQIGIKMSIEHAEWATDGDTPCVRGIEWIDPFENVIRNLTVYLREEDAEWRIVDLVDQHIGVSTSQLSLDDAFTRLGAYDFGFDNQCTALIASAVRSANNDESLLAPLRDRLLGILQGDSPTGAKDFVCRQLAMIGDESCIPTLAALLRQDTLCHIALSALEGIPSDAVDRVLVEAMDEVQGRCQQDIVDALGNRKCVAAVGLIAELTAASSEDVAASAVVALSKIGTPEAYQAIETVLERRADMAKSVLDACWDAMLVRADELVASQDTASAIALYDRLIADDAPPQVRSAAFIGKVGAMGESALPLVLSTLEGEDQVLAAAAAQSARSLAGQNATRALLESFQGLSLPLQIRLIGALGDRGDSSAAESIIPFLTYPDTEARLAAAEALSKIGGDSCLGPLVSMASWAPDSAERDVARDALTVIHGPGIAKSMRALLFSEPPESVREVIQILEARLAADAVPDLVRMVFLGHMELDARSRALKALGKLAPPEHFEFMMALLESLIEEWLRGDLERAIIEVAGRVPDASRVRETLIGMLQRNPRIAAKCSLLRIMGSVGDEEFLPVLRAATQETAPPLKDAAIRALADWPRISALDALAQVMNSSDDNTYRVIAARGVLRLLATAAEIDADSKLAYCREALEIAQTIDEKRIILGALAQMRILDTFALIEPLIEVPELHDDAALAIHKIIFSNTKPLAARNNDLAPFAMDSDLNSRWSTIDPQQPGVYYGLDLGAEYEISAIVLDAGTSLNDYPRAFDIRVADSPDFAQSRLVTSAEGANTVVRVTFEPTRARAIWITITGADSAPWAIHELSFTDPESGGLGIHFIKQ